MRQLPAGAESREALEDLRTSFPAGAITPTHVYVSGDEKLDRDKLAEALTALAASRHIAA